MAEPYEVTLGDWLAPILELEDRIGVLSVYLDADPALAAGDRPAWQAPVRAGLGELVKEAREEWPRDDRIAFEARLAELEPKLASFLGRGGASRGRALFAAIESGSVQEVELHALLPSLVAFETQAVVLPIVAVRQRGRPAGVAELSSARIVISEWELGILNEVETVELEPVPDDHVRPATNPAVPHTFPERDRFQASLDARISARTREAAAGLRLRADERGWDVIVVDGDSRLVEALSDGLGPAGPELLQSSQPFSGSRAETADRVEAALRDRRRADEKRLVDQLDASAAATRDVTVVERALAEGRVEHLLLQLPAEQPGSATAESLFRRALATRAQVTVLDEAVGALGPDGVAALLRW